MQVAVTPAMGVRVVAMTCIRILLVILAAVLMHAWLVRCQPDKLRKPKRFKKRLWHA
jgi:hypothetical protein